MQESNERREEPLLVVAWLIWGGCLKSRRFDECTRHLHCLWQNADTCSHGYPQKMGNENSGINLLDSSYQNAVDNSRGIGPKLLPFGFLGGLGERRFGDGGDCGQGFLELLKGGLRHGLHDSRLQGGLQ